MQGFFLICVSSARRPPLTQIDLLFLHETIPDIQINWLDPGKAAEIFLSDMLSPETLSFIQDKAGKISVDVFLTPATHRRKKLLLADMDATIVEGETLDALAAYTGLEDHIAAITTRAMRGELDFKAALDERVQMLRGLPVIALDKTLSDITINPGARDTIRVMRAHGAECYLVSGGFTYFTHPVAEACGFNGHHGNQLEIKDGHLTGKVCPPILDKESKQALLYEYTSKLGLLAEQTMAVGDGANDIPMLLAAGTGVGYCPKPVVQKQIFNAIIHTDLTSLLYIQGYTGDDIK